MIYFMQSKSDGYIKIGFTNNVGRRLLELQTGSPQGIDLLATMDGDTAVEKQLHRKFRDYHVRLEWFEPANAIIQYIDSINIYDVTNHRLLDRLHQLDVEMNALPEMTSEITKGIVASVYEDDKKRVIQEFHEVTNEEVPISCDPRLRSQFKEVVRLRRKLKELTEESRRKDTILKALTDTLLDASQQIKTLVKARG